MAPLFLSSNLSREMYSLSLEWKPRSFALSLLLNRDRMLSSLSGSFRGSSRDGVDHMELLDDERSEKKLPARTFYKSLVHKNYQFS